MSSASENRGGFGAEDRPDLPNFESPPVAEVVLSVQFEPLGAMRAPHIGLLWTEFRDQLPRTEDKPPLDSVIEDFGPPQRPRVRIEALDVPPLPRVWFLNEHGTELIQVQPDRFIHNWRRVGDKDKYPRYEKIRESFCHELELFARFVSRENLGDLRFNQCEVTYVNHIHAEQGWERHGEIEKIFSLWSERQADAFLKEPENAMFTTRYRIPDSEGKSIGRLHVQAQPGWGTSDGKPLYSLTLTARGAPQGEGIEGASRFLDIGRAWIVQGFASITTSRMHSIWRRLGVE